MEQGQVSATTRLVIGYAASNLCTFLLAKGLITADMVGPLGEWLVGATPFIIAVVHGSYVWWNSRKVAKVTAVQAMDGVQVSTTSPALATAVPGVTLK